MKLGCCAYSYRDKLTSGAMTFEGFLDQCVDLGFDGVEITSYYLNETDRASLNALKRACFARGLDVSGVAVGTNFCQLDDDKRAADIRNTAEWIYRGAALGAPFIRVFAGPVPEGDTEEAAFDRCLACLEDVIERGERHGVVVALENHGGVTATAAQVEKLVKAIGPTPWFGVNLDTGNFRNPDEEFAAVAPYVVTVHAKAKYTSVAGERTDVDWTGLRAALEAAGYRGYLNMEYEEPEDCMIGVPALMEKLVAAFRG